MFFSKKEAETPDEWRDKYVALSEERKQVDKAHLEQEQLLCRAVIRLSLAATGFDRELDPHLRRIREQLKAGIDSEKLKAELEIFTQAVTQLQTVPAKKQPLDVELLFAFLLQQYSSPKQQRLLQQIKEQAENDRFATIAQLFSALLPALEAEHNPHLLPDDAELSHHIDTDIVSKQLLHLFESIQIPSVFERQAQTVRQLLVEPSKSTSIFEPVLNRSVDLLLKITQYNQVEQQDVDKFLSDLTDKLAELTSVMAGVSFVATETAECRKQHDQSVTAQVEQLQLSSAGATSLDSLKDAITDRLSKITKEIHFNSETEQAQRQKSEQQLEELNERIANMESESSELKSKLILANIQALRDSLTGLPNRTAYDERMETEIARWKRYKSPLSLIIWDIDHFKRINDTFGHKAGDKVLLLIARQLSAHSRETDFISRFGGEEFTMLLPNTSIDSALILANQLRTTIEKTGFNSNGKAVEVTISCGIAEFSAGDTDETVFERADKALYQAKQQGRNQCCIG
ncbi:MAG: GGDEF domain-containing protein [Methylococcales bacterium]|nr:diguanylate cyclase [Methylococcaceae bacterium]